MSNKKKFIITIDTEGDNLWSWHNGDPITTNNSLFLQRFQNLCDEYGFKTTWLTNYEMIQDDRYLEFARKLIDSKTGEIGMHLHAWNCPPYFDLPVEQNGQPYLIEYPLDVMEEKIAFMTNLIEQRIGSRPIVHRAGRWAMNQDYYNLLEKYGYQVDCSVIPHVNGKKSIGQTKGFLGPDYTKYSEQPYNIGKILEVPMTIRKIHNYFLPERMTLKKSVGSFAKVVLGSNLWFRPNGYNLKKMMFLSDLISSSDQDDYIMFMIHSSELMPGGSPTFKDEASIENLYHGIEVLFEHCAKCFEGYTLSEYAKLRK